MSSRSERITILCRSRGISSASKENVAAVICPRVGEIGYFAFDPAGKK
ncbi:MAG: hypothetical protein ACR2FY_00220 [Pirellulaceae bacterium]